MSKHFDDKKEFEGFMWDIYSMCREKGNIPEFVVITDENYASFFEGDPTALTGRNMQFRSIVPILIYSNYQYQVRKEAERMRDEQPEQ